MRRELDGCAGYDERLLEQAFAPAPDARLDAHLRGCARCRAARDRYLATADALAGALAVDPEPSAAVREPGSPRATSRARAVLALAVACAVALLGWLALRPKLAAPLAIRALSDGARVESRSLDRCSLLRGRAEFTTAGYAVVVTPLGEVRARDARFTVEVEEVGLAMKRSHAAAAVTVAVLVGAVVWVSQEGVEVEVPEGARSRFPAAEESARDAAAGAAVDTPPEAAVEATRETALEPPAPVARRLLATVVDEEGRGVEAAEVLLLVPASPTQFLFARGASAASGRVELAIEPLVDPSRQLEGVLVEDLGDTAPVSGSARIHVSRRGFDAGTFRSSREDGSLPAFPDEGDYDAGRLAIARSLALSGRVVDADGRGVPAASVLLQRSEFGDAFPAWRAEALGTTGEHGSIPRIPGVTARSSSARGSLLMAAAEAGFGWIRLPNVPDARDLAAVEIVIGRPVALAVRARDGAGRPVAGAQVHVEPRFEPLESFVGERPHAIRFGDDPRVLALFTSRTDEHGLARLDRLPMAPPKGGRPIAHAARYDVVAVADGFRRAWREGVDLSPERLVEVELTLVEARPFGLRGRVVDGEGAAVAGAAVAARPISAARSGAGPTAAATSAADGRFAIEGIDVDEAKLVVEARATGFVDATREVELRGEDVDDLELVLDRPLPVAGRIVDDTGAPVAGAGIILRNDRRQLSLGTRTGGFVPPEERPTGADGRFAFANAGAGEWRCSVLPPEPREAWIPPAAASVQGGDTDIVLVLRRNRSSAELVARVVDGATGEALDAREVMLLPEGGQPYFDGKERRSRGEVRWSGVPVGRWRAWVLVRERPPAHAAVDVRDGAARLDVELRVGRAAEVRGRLVAPGDARDASALLIGELATDGPGPGGGGWDEGALLRYRADVGPDGRFVAANLAPGTWRFTVFSEVWLGESHVEIASGAKTGLEIPLVRGGTLAFSGVDARERGVVRLEVVPFQGGGGPDARRNARVEGGRFAGEILLAPGDYRWRAGVVDLGDDDALDPETAPSGGFEVRAGERTEIVLPALP